MKALDDAGHVLIIFTVRGDHPRHVEDWLEFYEIPYDRVTNVKETFDVIVDDLAVPFVSWSALLPLLLPRS